MRRGATTAALLALSGCALIGTTSRTPPASVAFPTVRAQAAMEVQAGRYGIADRLLSDFASQYAGTTEATDAWYWRGLYRADPANRIVSADGAVAVIDSALVLPLDSAQRANFQSLRRIALAQRAGAPAASTAAGAAASDSMPKGEERASSDEIVRLRSELAKANAELERIKKRVAQPKP